MLGKHEAVVRLLLDNGAQLTVGDVSLFACHAAEQNSLELLQDIVHHGGNVTAPRSDGDTALHLAVSEGNIEIVKFLVNQGADIDKLNSSGWTPRTLADQQGHDDIKALFQSKSACTDDINIKSSSASSPFAHCMGRFRSEPTMRHVSDEGSHRSRDKSYGGSCHRRRNITNFENSLFGIMSAAHGNNISDGMLSVVPPHGKKSSANQNPCRVTIRCPEKLDYCGKLVLLPGSIKELLDIGAKKFDFLPTKVLSQDEAEISELGVIRDGDRLLLVSDDWRRVEDDDY